METGGATVVSSSFKTPGDRVFDSFRGAAVVYYAHSDAKTMCLRAVSSYRIDSDASSSEFHIKHAKLRGRICTVASLYCS